MEKKNIFKKISFLFLILAFNSNALSNSLPNREMIIILENTESENLESTLQESSVYELGQVFQPFGIGSMSLTFLVALNQKAAPIVVNKALIKNIIDHQNLFYNFINLDKNSLQKLYGHYNRFKGPMVIDNFKSNCQYMSKVLPEIDKSIDELIRSADLNKIDSGFINQKLKKIALDRRFNLLSAPDNMQKLNKNHGQIKALVLEMIVYTLCTWVDFQKDWQIKQVNEDTFLLIPNGYINDLNLNISNLKEQIKKPKQKFTPLEIVLGLKIDHMKNVDRSFFKNLETSKYRDFFPKCLKQIFITNGDIKKYNLAQTNLNIWSIYITGHGLPKHPKLMVLPQIIELKNLFEKRLKSPEFSSCFAHEKNPKMDHSFCKNHKIYKKYLNIIEKLNQKINNLTVNYEPQEIDNVLIASLPIYEFRDVLKFFNDEIKTCLLYYSSCFAGGDHYIEPYIEKNNNGEIKHLDLNYPVISGTPTENASLQEYPFINIPPYTDAESSIMLLPSGIAIEDIDKENKRLNLSSTLQFNNFFGALRKGAQNDMKSLLLLSYSLHPHTDKFGITIDRLIANIPLIRFAHSDHFELIPNDDSFIILNEKNSTKSNVINKDAALLYSDYISGKLTLDRFGEYNSIPNLISMLPNLALHIFEEINSSTLNLNDIINSFLPFPELGSSKIFWIKKLKCLNKENKKETFNNVMIARNVFNVDSLTKKEEIEELKTCAFFSNEKNKESKLTWDGPLIDENNYKISPWNNNDHKEECLNSFPKLTNFVSPVLQSI